MVTKKRITDKEKRLNMIKEILNEGNIKEHSDIKNRLKEEGYSISQSTISRDINSLGYGKNDEGIYIKTKATILSMKEDLLLELANQLDITSYLGIVGEETVTLRIPRGYEDYISNLMYYIFEDKIIGIIPGYGTILILTENKENAKFVFNFFKGDTEDL